MLTTEQEEVIGGALSPLFEYLEREVIVDVANRIRETMSYSRTAEIEAQRLHELGFSPARVRKEAMRILRADAAYRRVVAENTLKHKRMVKELLRGILRRAHGALNGLMASAADLSYLDDLHVWKQAGKKLTDKSFLPQVVEAMGRQTADTMKGLAQSTGFKTASGYEPVENLYRRELDKAMIKVCTGTFSRERAVFDTVRGLAGSGLRTVDFASGRSMQLDTAVKLAVRTGAHQVSARIMDANIQNTGENLVYVSKHWGARNTGTGHANHEQWQGKVYFIKDGTDYSDEARRIGQDRITSLWYATGYSADGTRENDPLGLNGYNCRHKHYVWFEGSSSLPKDDPEPEPVTVNGKTYDHYGVSQKMRSMERNVRALKREREALASLGADTRAVSAKIKGKIREYEEFCRKCGVKPDINRLRYECGTSDLTKTEAYGKYRETMLKGTVRAGGNVVPGKEPVCIGQVDVKKAGEAIRYFGEEIRKSDREKLVVIDKAGNVYYNEGGEDSVLFGSLDVTGCKVLHNHPKSKGMVSFGKDDFSYIRDTDAEEWYLVNEEFDYHLKKIKPMDGVTYNQAWKWYTEDITEADFQEDMQHLIMEGLAKRGYVEYERKAVDSRPAGKD